MIHHHWLTVLINNGYRIAVVVSLISNVLTNYEIKAIIVVLTINILNLEEEGYEFLAALDGNVLGVNVSNNGDDTSFRGLYLTGELVVEVTVNFGSESACEDRILVEGEVNELENVRVVLETEVYAPNVNAVERSERYSYFDGRTEGSILNAVNTVDVGGEKKLKALFLHLSSLTLVSASGARKGLVTILSIVNFYAILTDVVIGILSELTSNVLVVALGAVLVSITLSYTSSLNGYELESAALITNSVVDYGNRESADCAVTILNACAVAIAGKNFALNVYVLVSTGVLLDVLVAAKLAVLMDVERISVITLGVVSSVRIIGIESGDEAIVLELFGEEADVVSNFNACFNVYEGNVGNAILVVVNRDGILNYVIVLSSSGGGSIGTKSGVDLIGNGGDYELVANATVGNLRYAGDLTSGSYTSIDSGSNTLLRIGGLGNALRCFCVREVLVALCTIPVRANNVAVAVLDLNLGESIGVLVGGKTLGGDYNLLALNLDAEEECRNYWESDSLTILKNDSESLAVKYNVSEVFVCAFLWNSSNWLAVSSEHLKHPEKTEKPESRLEDSSIDRNI